MDAGIGSDRAVSKAFAEARDRAAALGVSLGGISRGDPSNVATPTDHSVTLRARCRNCKNELTCTVLDNGLPCIWYHTHGGAERCDLTKAQ
jgi:hypothetical protein